MNPADRPTQPLLSRALLAGLTLLLLSSAPCLADNLVIFKNGKAMRVKGYAKEGKWLKCQFEDKNSISVPLGTVLSIEEVTGNSREGELRPNQMAAGTGAPYSGGAQGPVGDVGVPPEAQPAYDNAQEQADIQAQFAEEEAARRLQQQQASGLATRGRRGGPVQPGQLLPGQPASQPGQPGFLGGFQPLNQAGTPFQNRGLRQRGLFKPGGQQDQTNNQQN